MFEKLQRDMRRDAVDDDNKAMDSYGSNNCSIQARWYIWIYETKGARYKAVPLIVNKYDVNKHLGDKGNDEDFLWEWNEELNNNNER